MRRSLLLAPLLFIAACGPPRVTTPMAEIPRIAQLSTLMDNQATVMDPLFKQIGATEFSPEAWEALREAATRTQATSLKIKDFSKGPAFDALAMQLNQNATDLGNAAAGHNVASTNRALTEMKATCRACHKQFR